MWDTSPATLSRISFSNPPKIETAMISDATPSATPNIEMYVMNEMNFELPFANRNLRAIKYL